MAAPRRCVDLRISDNEVAWLGRMARSRREAASRVERARMLLRYRDDPSFFAVGRALGVHHQTVQRCVDRALRHGVAAALDDSPRPGRTPQITGEARAWLVDLACRKAKDLGIRMSCGRRSCWRGTRANTVRRRAMPALPGWPRDGVQAARPARGEAAQGALLPRAPRPRVQAEDGRGLCVYREVARSSKRAERARRRRARRWRSSPTTKSRACRRSARRRPTSTKASPA